MSDYRVCSSCGGGGWVSDGKGNVVRCGKCGGQGLISK